MSDYKALIPKRILDKIKYIDNCWIWTGAVVGQPYEYPWTWHSRLRKSVRAHRYVYELVYGEFKAHLKVCHTCDNVLCLFPEHLFLGTQAENLQDMAQKGRSKKGRKSFTPSGIMSPASKLQITHLVDILKSTKAGEAQLSIANRLGVTQATISNVLNGKVYAEQVADLRQALHV